MRKIVVSVILAAVVLVSAQAQNASLSGQSLHDKWISYQRVSASNPNLDQSEVLNAGFYLGFVYGASTVAALDGWFNMPDGWAVGQSLAVVGRYLDQHPEEWNEQATTLVIKALALAWPVKK